MIWVGHTTSLTEYSKSKLFSKNKSDFTSQVIHFVSDEIIFILQLSKYRFCYLSAWFEPLGNRWARRSHRSSKRWDNSPELERCPAQSCCLKMERKNLFLTILFFCIFMTNPLSPDVIAWLSRNTAQIPYHSHRSQSAVRQPTARAGNLPVIRQGQEILLTGSIESGGDRV